MTKLGLIAGGGALPVEIARAVAARGRPLFVLRLKDLSDECLSAYDGVEVGLGDFAQAFQALQGAGVQAVCMAGYVKRPDFSALERDEGGAKVLPDVEDAGRRGDDALLRQVAAAFQNLGFSIEGAHEAAPELTLQPGLQAGPEPSAEALADAEKAAAVARAIGALDVGQAAVVARGLVLAVEAQEGTDGMLARVPGLPAHLRGTAEARCGVLAKTPKPIQERRLDLPTIGVRTVENAAAAGLAGIVGEAGGLLIVDRAAVAEACERLGVFLLGVAPDGE